jgi:hypothetical protein
MNTRPPFTCDALDRLPMFASDKEIATAIVGPSRAGRWLKESMPLIAARSGFPPVDKFHGGRPVALVKLFYERYLGVTRMQPGWRQDGQERPEVWTKSRRRSD